MNYAEALLSMKNGDAVCRSDWDGAFVLLQPAEQHPSDANYMPKYLYYDGDASGTNHEFDPTGDDLAADDWKVHGSPDEAESPVPEGETMPGGQDLTEQHSSEGVVEGGEPKFVESGEPVTVDRTDDQVHDDKDDVFPLFGTPDDERNAPDEETVPVEENQAASDDAEANKDMGSVYDGGTEDK